MSRGVHVNINGPGLPKAGGHITLFPSTADSKIAFEPADPATRKMTPPQWNKACECVLKYLDNPTNIDRLVKSAQAGIDANPKSHRATEIEKVGLILQSNRA